MDLTKYQDVLKGNLLLLNAPKSAGKDTVANRIMEITGCAKGQFKDHLYVLTAVAFNVKYEWFVEQATDIALKEEKSPVLGNLSPREALIFMSERCIKPAFGKNYFGNIEATKFPARRETGVVYADCGFIEEVHPLIAQAKPENTFIIKFTRKGSEDFSGDSRNWLPQVEGTKVFVTANNGKVDEIVTNILDFI